MPFVNLLSMMFDDIARCADADSKFLEAHYGPGHALTLLQVRCGLWAIMVDPHQHECPHCRSKANLVTIPRRFSESVTARLAPSSTRLSTRGASTSWCVPPVAPFHSSPL